MIRFIKLFDKWYVARENRRGCEVDDTGGVELVFEDMPPDAVLLFDGRRVLGEDGRYTVTATERSHAVTVLLPDGMVAQAEGIKMKAGVVIPAGFDKEDMLLALAERVAQLEEAEARDRAELQAIEDKNNGKYFLGGTKK